MIRSGAAGAVFLPLLVVGPLSAQLVDPPEGERARLCFEGDPRPMPVRSLQGADPATDLDAPVPFDATFTPADDLLVTELGGPVLLLRPDLTVVREYGRQGPGPGEYEDARAAVMTDDGTVVVLDLAPPSLLVFRNDGSLEREIRLETVVRTLHAVGDDVYLVAPVGPFLPDRAPLVLRLAPGAPAPEPVLRFREEWRDGPPFHRAVTGTPILRERGGRLFLGVRETGSIAEVDLDRNRLVPIVSGCVPPLLRDAYSGGGDRGAVRPTASLIADYAVLADGRFLVRTGLVAEGGRRGWLLYSAGGEVLAEWVLEPADVTLTSAAIHPRDPDLHFTWSFITGESHLLRVGGAP